MKTEHWIVFVLLLGVAVCSVTSAFGRSFTEVRVQCDRAITLSLVPGPNDGDPPTLQAEVLCTTLDAQGTPLRQLTRNLATRFTTPQIQTLTRLLQRLELTAAQAVGLPTPAATPTDIAVRTPRPEPT